MKIYFIKLDTMPFCNDVKRLVDISGGIFLRHIAGCSTLPSVVPMLTGKLASDLTPHGIGYNTWKTSLNNENHPEYSWAKNYLHFNFLKKKFRFVNRNFGDFLKIIGLEAYPQFSNDHTTPYDQHDGYSYLYLTERGDEWFESRKNEFQWINKIQNGDKKNNVFYFINYSHFHATVERTTLEEHNYKCRIAGQNVVEILNHYDFSEAGSLFWIYSDHGPWQHPSFDKYPQPDHFYTWAIVRDNTENPLQFPSKVLSHMDFKYFLESKIQKIQKVMPSSKDRIFFTEDGRAPYGEKMTTAIACQFRNWDEKFPKNMTYVTWHEVEKIFVQTEVEFNEDTSIKNVVKQPSAFDNNLINSLVERFSWVTK